VTDANKDNPNVPAGDSVNKDNPVGGAQGGSGNPGSQPSDTDGKIADLNKTVTELIDSNKKLQDINEANQQQIGRLGDELGQQRQQQSQNVDLGAYAEQFSKDLDSDDPNIRLNAINNLVSGKMAFSEQQETERIKRYRSVVDRIPELKDIGYDQMMTEVRVNGTDQSELTSFGGIERTLSTIKGRATAGNMDQLIKDAEARGAEAQMKKLKDQNLINTPNTGSPPDNGQSKKPVNELAKLGALVGNSYGYGKPQQ